MAANASAALSNEMSVRISRAINAPRERVFGAWTDPQQLARWWGPDGFTNPVCDIDARPGGKMRIHMRAPDGTVYPMTGTFREIDLPQRLVFTAVAEDHAGNALLESYTTVTFDERGGTTMVTVEAKAVGLAPSAPQMLAGMNAGWTQSLERLDAFAGKNEDACGTGAKPGQEHAWLQKLVGDWNAEMTCVMGPDQPPMKSEGTEVTRSIGGLWTMGEGSGGMPDGSKMTSVITLGYDPQKQRFVGTFIASMMTHMWLYEGTLDGAGKVLTLNTEGPAFGAEGKMAKYQDIMTFHNDDHRTLTSRMLGDDGTWTEFMTAHYRRKK